MHKSSRKFGIEFEFECDWKIFKGYAAKAINKIYGRNKYYAEQSRFRSDFKLDKWHIKEENSDVVELTTPVSCMKDLDRIKEVIDSFHNKVNPQDDCDIHVHIDVHDINQYHIMAAWLLSEEAIIRCFPESRRLQGFCEKIINRPQTSRSLIAKILAEETDASNHSDAIDLTEYEERQTIEIRLCEGSTDGTWIKTWVKFLLSWIDYVKKKNPSLLPCEKCNSLHFDHLIDELTIDKKSKKIMIERYEKYHKGTYWI